MLDVLYPPRCPFCGKIVKRQTGGGASAQVCSVCRKALPFVSEPRCMKCGKPVSHAEQEYCMDCQKNVYAYDEGRSLLLHRGNVSRAVYQFKYHNKRSYAPVFAEMMAEQYADWVKRKQITELIPVPLHASRKRSRGYNQAELLAEELGKRWGLPVRKNVVFRIKKTKRQKELNDRERAQNLKNAFGVSAKWSPGKSVLIIDDIYTTGSTIHHLAKILKMAGVQKVYFLTISIGQGL